MFPADRWSRSSQWLHPVVPPSLRQLGVGGADKARGVICIQSVEKSRNVEEASFLLDAMARK